MGVAQRRDRLRTPFVAEFARGGSAAEMTMNLPPEPQDPALLAREAGFRALYLSGAGVANASFGLPDLGVTSLNDVCEDIRRITGATDLPLLVDATLTPPWLLRPIAHGADLVLHSTTKYINGHSDVVGGAVIARDAALAEDVRQRDKEVDQLYNAIFRVFLTNMMEDPRNISACMHLHFIAKNIERVGDHATGIAEQVIYLATGAMPDDARPKSDGLSEGQI